jgi:hypothetical protein
LSGRGYSALVAVCARCGARISWRRATFADKHCDDCRGAIEEEHWAAIVEYQRSLQVLRRSFGEVVASVEAIRGRQIPAVLPTDERVAIEAKALGEFVDTVMPAGVLPDWGDAAVHAVARAIGADRGASMTDYARDEDWQRGFGDLGEKVLAGRFRAGRAVKYPMPPDLVPEAGEALYWSSPATLLWVVVKKELAFDHRAVDLGANKDLALALRKGSIRGREIEVRRRVASHAGRVLVTSRRVIFLAKAPLLDVEYGFVGRAITTDREVRIDITGWDAPVRLKLDAPATAQAIIEMAAAKARGLWQPPPLTPCPDTPPLNARDEELVVRAIALGWDRETVRLLRLAGHVGTWCGKEVEQSLADAEDRARAARSS